MPPGWKPYKGTQTQVDAKWTNKHVRARANVMVALAAPTVGFIVEERRSPLGRNWTNYDETYCRISTISEHVSAVCVLQCI